MAFQKWLQKNTNRLMLASAILIGFGFLGKYVFANELAWNLTMLIASILGGLPIGIHAYQALKFKQISIDLLVTIAVMGAIFIREFEESAIVTFLFTFGTYLEKRTLEKTRSSIKELSQMAPTRALFADGREIDIDKVKVGDKLLIKTGSQVPVDGRVYGGSAFINEGAITGGSREIEKNSGEQVFSGSILVNGSLYVTAEKFIDRFAKYYTPIVLLIAIITWLVSQNLELAITILVLGCPGALVIGAPVSNVAAIGNGAKNGLLIKGGEVMDTFSRVDTLLFDKTGTLTKGETEVVLVKKYGEISENLLTKISTIESQSNHPLATAIVRFIGSGHTKGGIDQLDVVKGQGIIADDLLIGNEKLLTAHEILLTDSQKQSLREVEEKGMSIVLVAKAGQLKLIYGIADEIRPDVKRALTALRRNGMKKMVMLTGDNEVTARNVAKELGIDEVHANLLPEDKARIVSEFKSSGHKLAFIGDGINDSPSLALADIGIAMGSGTDIAIETSDVVLMKSSFAELVQAYGLAKNTVRNMRQNIGLAIAVVIFLLVSLILGGTGFVPNFVNMGTGMFIHEVSILGVILNGMRLISYKNKKIN